MSFYSDMADVTVELLTEFGRSVTLKRSTGNSIDPITGVVTPGVDASVITTGVLKPYPSRMIDGVRILSTDRELTITNEQTPAPTDKPTMDGEEWAIVGITEMNPAGTVIAYKIQVRR